MSLEKEIPDDAGVPPLEDMSDVLEKMGFYDPKKEDVQTSMAPPTEETTTENVTISKPSLKSKGTAVHVDSPGTKKSSTKSTESVARQQKTVSTGSKDSTFGGLKKGFLFSSKPVPSKRDSSTKGPSLPSEEESKVAKKKTKRSSVSPKKADGSKVSQTDEIPFLKAQPTAENGEKLVFPEVQDALKSKMPLLASKEWVTEDLLKRVQSNPTLRDRMTDPNFMKMLENFHSNPGEVMRKYASNPEMSQFLKEFCALMGDHFTKLADKEETAEKKRTSKEQPLMREQRSNPEEDKAIKELIKDPDVQRALMDPSIQRLLQDLKDNPDQAQRNLQKASPEVKKMISLLISKQLLAVQR
jgi:hypothetical protein